MTERRLVKAGGAEFYVEVSDTGGPTTIRDAGPLSFDGVRQTVEGIATRAGAGMTAGEAGGSQPGVRA